MESNLANKNMFFIFLTIFVYFWNFWLNSIWIPNEAFYAEAVREMFEAKNFLDIYYNYEPRFNKPPLTYWTVAISVFLFGLNEFAIRLPIVLMAIGSSFFTYRIAKLLYNNNEAAIYSFFAFALSLQFVVNSRYASPEIPLTFFLILTMYLFLKGYKENKPTYLYLSYISLGLTVLTKGFPYYVVAAGIVGFYLLIESNFSLREFLKKLIYIKLPLGLPISIIIGMSWIVYMHLKFGDEFWKVYSAETVKRAFGEDAKLADIFFYPYVILWGFLPYSLTFYYVFVNYFKELFKRHSFVFSWFITLLIIFTIAKGKIPTYFIQAHTPMAIIVGYYIANHHPEGFKKYLFNLSLIVPAFLITILNIYIVYNFNLDYLLYIFAIFPILYLIRYRDLRIAPFLSILATFMILTISLLPYVEKYRPYREIGSLVDMNVPDRSIPLIIENRFIHNLPFYAKRKVLRDFSSQQILNYVDSNRFTIALVEEDTLEKLKNPSILWQGYIYTSSESRFTVFLNHINRFKQGKSDRFVKMYLVYINQK